MDIKKPKNFILKEKPKSPSQIADFWLKGIDVNQFKTLDDFEFGDILSKYLPLLSGFNSIINKQ